MEKSVGAIIFRPDGKFLLLQYEEGHIDFVKGHAGAGEFHEDTLRREIYEETGIRGYKIIDGFKERISYEYKRNSKKHKKEVIFYLAKTNEKKITLSYEHKDFFWLDFREAIDKLTYDNAKNVLEKAHSFLKSRMP